MTKKEYLAKAKPNISINIDGVTVNADVREFTTGSCGYNANGKIKIPLQSGEVLTYQLSMNIIAVGSKEWAKEDGQASS